MTDYDNTNSGALFKNDKGGNPNRPDYKGSINVEGVDMWLSAWLKTAASGQKYMSLSVQHKEPKQGHQQSPSAQAAEENSEAPDFDDAVPF